MSPFAGLALEKTSTVVQVQEGLRRLIVTGEVRPGERLVESAIATEIEVSRNTVREALRGLVEGRLVKYRSNRGFSVSKVEIEDVQEIYEVRRIVELGALGRWESGFAAQRAKLEESQAQLHRSLKQSDWNGIVNADASWHMSIVEMTGSSRLVEFVRGLFNEMRLALVSYDRLGGGVETIARPHAEILAALELGDGATARQTLERHLVESCARVVEHLATA